VCVCVCVCVCVINVRTTTCQVTNMVGQQNNFQQKQEVIPCDPANIANLQNTRVNTCPLKVW